MSTKVEVLKEVIFMQLVVIRHISYYHSKDNSRRKQDIWLRPMTKKPLPTNISKGQNNNTNHATKSSITQRLQTDLRR